ncbi:branched-chain amino acid ABC transporter substrate-binding protein [Lysinibacter cavernae]|uniref:Branched-chain amino acid transport system substrate-binding protein n=1 Tax=Lysinibacter cavernae TaxID=1640652 RepID=A0A7X5TUV4_9MICO|nr:branched-chain amino acid ABC transporter substrate-binding protein [Lysinibacter cavernae]NIH54848.1 branched-chain amino acid transport system substrate-binding protein [Lysinibacter cavernae]
MKRPKMLVISLVAATALTLTGCSGGLLGGGSSDEDGPIKFGMLAPLTGSEAAVGPFMKNGAQMAVDEINEAGGVLGRQIELDVQDEACDPVAAVAAANKVVSNGAVVSVGGYCSGATLPTLPVFEKANIPMLIPAANSEDLVNEGLKNVFMVNATGSQQADAAAKYIEKVGAKNVAIIDDTTSYSTDIAKATAELLKEKGVEVQSSSVTPGESDYSSAVNKALSITPDFIYWTGYFQEGGLILNQVRQAGYTNPYMVGDGSVSPTLIEIAGADVAEGALATMTQTPDTIKGAEDWIANYTEQFGSEPGPYSTQSYDAVRIAAHAIEEAGSTDGDKIIEALEAIDGFEIFSGPLKFTDRHTLSVGGFQILVVENGAFVLKDNLQ